MFRIFKCKILKCVILKQVEALHLGVKKMTITFSDGLQRQSTGQLMMADSRYIVKNDNFASA